MKNILQYEAYGDGKTLNTKAVQNAIDDISRDGGGTVYVPPGSFLVGGLELKSGVTLYLEAGAVLLGSKSINDYAYHPGPPMQGDANGHHLIFADQCENVTICGMGSIDGQGQAYWEPKPSSMILPPAEEWRAVTSQKYQARNKNQRPSPMIEFARCRNIRIYGVTLKNSAGWTLRSVSCETVMIEGVVIRNPDIGVNGDGLDISCSQNVIIANCDIKAGDDAICLKSENPYGEVTATRNVTVTNCLLTTPCNGFKIGTASHGVFENIVFSNSIIYSDGAAPLSGHVIGGINIEMVDGGRIDGVVASNVRMQNVRAPIFIRLGVRNKGVGSCLRNILIENVDATGATITSSITGVPDLRPSDISITNCRIRTVEQGKVDWVNRLVPEAVERYPEATMLGKLPAYGFFIRHADRVRLRDVECIADKPDDRPAVVCYDTNDLVLSALELTAPRSGFPLIELHNVQHAFLTGMRLPYGADFIARICGRATSGISFAGNSFALDGRTVVFLDGAEAGTSRFVR